MIADQVWAKWWALWTDQFLTARGMAPRSHASMLAFRGSIERRLTTEEFEEAAERIFDHARWFPTPGEVVASVDISNRGRKAWASVASILDETPVGERLPRFRELEERTRRALDAMKGTLDRLDMNDPLRGRILGPAEHGFLLAYRSLVNAELEPRRIASGEVATVRRLGAGS